VVLSFLSTREPWPSTARGVLTLLAASAVLFAVAAALLFLLAPGFDTFARLLVFHECVGLTMLACALLLRRLRRFDRLTPRARWLSIGAVAIPTGYLVGHQIAFVLLGEPMRLAGFHHVSLVPVGFTLLLGGLALHQVMTREQLAREALARAEAQRLAAEAQLRLLRTQLEPHMLFNTLANLRALLREDTDRAESMIDRLIVYLRATLAASQTEAVPLAREFSQLRAYLEIMSLRMGPRLTWRLALPAALESTLVPPMLLQPLVENAIKHGLEPKVGAGHVEVVACATTGGIEIRIDDNGLGLPARDPSDTADDDAARPDGSSYGLRHVRERLQAAYGPAARLELQPLRPSGVRSAVFLPARTAPRGSP
jgi:signal transduction histidine kinase